MVICVSVPAEALAGVTEVIAGDEVSARYVGGFENSEGYISTGIPCSVFVIPSFIRCASVAGDDDCLDISGRLVGSNQPRDGGVVNVHYLEETGIPSPHAESFPIGGQRRQGDVAGRYVFHLVFSNGSKSARVADIDNLYAALCEAQRVGR